MRNWNVGRGDDSDEGRVRTARGSQERRRSETFTAGLTRGATQIELAGGGREMRINVRLGRALCQEERQGERNEEQRRPAMPQRYELIQIHTGASMRNFSRSGQ
jgi:hypothetical protein